MYVFQYFFLTVSSLQSDDICLNPKQTDNTTKTSLDLQARCVGDGIQLQEAKSNPETHSVNRKVRYALNRGIYALTFEEKVK